MIEGMCDLMCALLPDSVVSIKVFFFAGPNSQPVLVTHCNSHLAMTLLHDVKPQHKHHIILGIMYNTYQEVIGWQLGGEIIM